MTKCTVQFLIQFTPTDFDAAGPAQFRVECFIVLIELVDTQEGGSEWLGKRRSPDGGFVAGAPFCGPADLYPCCRSTRSVPVL